MQPSDLPQHMDTAGRYLSSAAAAARPPHDYHRARCTDTGRGIEVCRRCGHYALGVWQPCWPQMEGGDDAGR